MFFMETNSAISLIEPNRSPSFIANSATQLFFRSVVAMQAVQELTEYVIGPGEMCSVSLFRDCKFL